VPRRHVATWFEATQAEKIALLDALEAARAAIELSHTPDGYNIGVNSGRAAGQTLFHLHLHLIPRYEGDTLDPRGGVRHVIPAKARYWIADAERAPVAGVEAEPLLVTGRGSVSLSEQLRERLSTAAEVDIAVAFVMPSGLDLIGSTLEEALVRGARVRILTGDYLDATNPVALRRLLDLKVPNAPLELRVYQTQACAPESGPWSIAFHPKAYIFRDRDGRGYAYVGSSNLSRIALTNGVEWNYRVLSSRDGRGFGEVCAAFEELFRAPPTTELTSDWIDRYQGRRRPMSRVAVPDTELPPTDERTEIPTPHPVQVEAIEALRQARGIGVKTGLVVLATGLGKTWLSAFDSREFERVLFVAHREEILAQAMHTYRRIRPDDRLGYYNGLGREPDAQVIFASIQTLGRPAHLYRFAESHFDYIVIDEFHHAAAATYRRLLQHFKPTFLLGLTATPERSDGADLLDLCGGQVIFRCDVADGIRRDLLCPFDYYGVPDEVDYRNIPWRSGRFDETELTTAVSTNARAQNALEQLERRGGDKALAFCVSQRHADFMAGFLVARGKRAVAVHSGPTSAPRSLSLERLQAGELDVVCAVDMFNEGVDLPDLDTVLMLRPTESKIVWMQQFGRGLRKAAEGKRLKVIDYIGNHRSFLLKPQILFNLQPGDQYVQALLEQLRANSAELPPGCSVTYDLEAIDILRGLLRVAPNASEALRAYVQDFVQLHGVRPTALEAYRDGYTPRAVRPHFGSWFGFLGALSLLEPAEEAVLGTCPEFLRALEVTRMTRSFKMVTLLGMLNADRFPGAIELTELSRAVMELCERQSAVRADFGDHCHDEGSLAACLRENPIAAWTGAADGGPYFEFEGARFTSKVIVPDEHKPPLQLLTRELAEWRLAEYLEGQQETATDSYIVKVTHSGGNPILMPLDRDKYPELPNGWTPFVADGRSYIGNFVKVALNVARREGSERNELPGILRGWFGPEAGAPGTRHQVILSKVENGWKLEPVGAGAGGLIQWKTYSREQIPGLFGLTFSTSIWQQGFIRSGERLFLLVTLDKSAAAKDHQYEDQFLSPTEFQWQSQNRTAQDSPAGRAIRDHQALGIEVHLFVRTRSKTLAGKASPFVYCGQVEFQRWDRERPITVFWRLREAVPERLRTELRVPVDHGSG
jgi:superfamily II DNA or RNA helicase/HKD family nuclease